MTMATVLGIISGSVQLVDAALQTGFALYKVVSRLQKAPKIAHALAGDLQISIQILSKIQIFHKKNATITSEAGWNELGVVATRCSIDFAEMKIKLNNHQTRFWIRFKNINDSDFMEMRSKIAAHNRDLTLVLQLINRSQLRFGTFWTMLTFASDAQMTTQTMATKTNATIDQANTTISTTIVPSLQQLQCNVTSLSAASTRTINHVQSVDTNILNLNDTVIKSTQTINRQINIVPQTVVDKLGLLVQPLLDSRHQQSQDIHVLQLSLENFKSQIMNNQDNFMATSLTHQDQETHKLTQLIHRLQMVANGARGKSILEGAESQGALKALRDVIKLLQNDATIRSQHIEDLDSDIDASKVVLYAAKIINIEKAAGTTPIIKSMRQVQRVRMLNDGVIHVSTKRAKIVPKDMEFVETNICWNPMVLQGETRQAFTFRLSQFYNTQTNFTISSSLRTYKRIDTSDFEKETIFQLVRKSDLDTVRLMLSDGRASIFDCDEDGKTLAHYACHSLGFKIIDSEEKSEKINAMVQYLVDTGVDFTQESDNGRLPINELRMSNKAFVSPLVERPLRTLLTVTGPLFNVTHKSDYSTRWKLLAYPYNNATFKLLLDMRQCINLFSDYRDHDSEKLSPLLLDVISLPRWVYIFEKDPSNPLLVEFKPLTPQRCNVVDRLSLLLEADLNTSALDVQGRGCLHHALSTPVLAESKPYITQILDILLQNQADIYARDNNLIWLGDHRVYRTITMCAYGSDLQDVWWDAIERAGFEKSEVLSSEAISNELDPSVYEAELDKIAAIARDLWTHISGKRMGIMFVLEIVNNWRIGTQSNDHNYGLLGVSLPLRI